MRYLRNRFFAGLLILAPAAVTGWILWKLFTAVDGILDPVRQRYPVIDHPGVGVAVVLLLVIAVGVFAGNFIGHRVISMGERMLYRLPLVRRIYHAVKELAGVFLSDRKMVFKRVVLIHYPHPDSYALAFVTEEATESVNDLIGRRVVHVFVPTTPNPTSGFLLFLPVDQVVDVPIDVEDAMKMVISGGVYIPAPLQDAGTGSTPVA
jgi:uncharacterized membrane protein